MGKHLFDQYINCMQLNLGPLGKCGLWANFHKKVHTSFTLELPLALNNVVSAESEFGRLVMASGHIHFNIRAHVMSIVQSLKLKRVLSCIFSLPYPLQAKVCSAHSKSLLPQYKERKNYIYGPLSC